MAFGNDFYQIQVSFVVLRQQDKVVIALFLHPVISLGNVNLAADDGLDIRMLLGVLEELFDTVHVAMVRDGKGRHTKLFGTVEKVFYGGLSIQNGILGMDVQVNETHRQQR